MRLLNSLTIDALTVRTYNLLFSMFKENKISGISKYSVGGAPTVAVGLSFSVTM